jgi:hypothetical protein
VPDGSTLGERDDEFARTIGGELGEVSSDEGPESESIEATVAIPTTEIPKNEAPRLP